MSDSQEPGVKHVFGEIEELDNKLPNWWLGILWGSIAFAFAYWFYFQTAGLGPSDQQEYEAELAAFKARIEAGRQAPGEGDPEAFAALLADPQTAAAGLPLYQQNCAACHGPQGQGLIGPNLTDRYFLHGGSAAEIHAVIASGKPEKGMPGWDLVLGAERVRQLAAFVLTLPGQDLPGKEPQGERVD